MQAARREEVEMLRFQAARRYCKRRHRASRGYIKLARRARPQAVRRQAMLKLPAPRLVRICELINQTSLRRIRPAVRQAYRHQQTRWVLVVTGTGCAYLLLYPNKTYGFAPVCIGGRCGGAS